MGGAYSYAKLQGFLSPDLHEEEVYGSTNSGSSTVPASSGFAMPVGICPRMSITDKTITDEVYDEQKQKNNEVMGEIKNRELTKWREWGTWWKDPGKKDFGESVRREFATKVVPHVKAKFTNWEAALAEYGTRQGCNGPLVIEKVGLALLFGRVSSQIGNLEGAAAALIFLGSGSKTAEALTIEQLQALERQLAR